MEKKIGIKRGHRQFFLFLLCLLFSAIAITSGCGSGDDSSSATTNNGGGASGGGAGGGGGATVPAAPTLASVQCSFLGGNPCCNLVGTWNSVSGATSYNLYYLIDPAYTPSPDVIKNTGTKIAGVSSGYTYTFNSKLSF